MLSIRGLRVLGTHGVLPEEQARAQPFEVDLDVEADLSVAAATDRLDDTLDYASLVEAAHRVVASEHHQLLERIAGRLCEVALEDPRVLAVTATIRKLRPPVPADLATAGVTLRRIRDGGRAPPLPIARGV